MTILAETILVLCIVAVLGIALGRVRIRNFSLEVGGVLFAGLAVGHVVAQFGIPVNWEALHYIQELGLILFVYTIGIEVGPGFFAALKRAGLTLNSLAALIVVLGASVAAWLHVGLGIPLPVALGLFSGGVTNTPSLAAGQQILSEVGAPPEALVLPGLGYAVAYPFGIIGIILTMTLIRALLRIDVGAEAKDFEHRQRAAVAALDTMNVVLRNPNFFDLPVSEIPGLQDTQVVLSRLRHNGELSVPHADTRLAENDVLHLVGPRAKLKEMRLMLGESTDTGVTTTQGTALRWERLVVTRGTVLGKAIASLAIPQNHDVVISRVSRAGVELLPSPALHLQFGDILTVIGQPEDLKQVAELVGNREQALQRTQMIPLFLGIGLGVVIGSLPIVLPGAPTPLRLGLSGGPLIAALVLARVGHIGPLVWFIPPSANHALREFGIILFLAIAGLRSGGRFVEVLLSGEGFYWMACGALITLIPLLLVGFLARAIRLNYLSLCGLLAGSMTDPPALAAAVALARSEAQLLAYATVYPLVMCLRVLAPQVLVLLLWSGAG